MGEAGGMREPGRQEQYQRCQQKCFDKFKHEQEKGQGGRDNDPREDPEKAKRECLDKCKEEYTKRDDRERCEWKHCRGRRGERSTHYQGREQEQETGEKSPYVFQDEHFTSQLRTEHGMLKILQKFSKRSEVLRVIDNFRVAMLEADPQTFVVPNHVDADVLFFVTQGGGTLSLVRPEKRESFNIKQGDVVRIPAGITAYIINRDNNQKLVLAKLIRPISTPGSFESDNKGWTCTKSNTKVSSRLRRGVVFVMPAGHPVAVMASINQNLEMVGFEVNAKNDETFPLAGKRNVVNQLEREAMELAFGVSSGGGVILQGTASTEPC